MAKSRNQKAKILVLEHLLEETGENRAVTMQEILEKLTECGVNAERKSIYDDLDALREFDRAAIILQAGMQKKRRKQC